MNAIGHAPQPTFAGTKAKLLTVAGVVAAGITALGATAACGTPKEACTTDTVSVSNKTSWGDYYTTVKDCNGSDLIKASYNDVYIPKNPSKVNPPLTVTEQTPTPITATYGHKKIELNRGAFDGLWKVTVTTPSSPSSPQSGK